MLGNLLMVVQVTNSRGNKLGVGNFFPTLLPSLCLHQYTTLKKLVAVEYHYAKNVLFNWQDDHCQWESTAVSKRVRLATFPNLNIQFLKRQLFWLQKSDYVGRTGLVFLQFYPWSSKFKMLLIHTFYKAVAFWKTPNSTAPFEGYHPNIKILSKDLHRSLGVNLSNNTFVEGYRWAERKSAPGFLKSLQNYTSI